MKEFNKIILKKRKELNLSVREAAKRIGISHSYLDKLEKGIDNRTGTFNKPTPETLSLISNAYGIDYNYLLEICDYIDDDKENYSANPDIRLIARAGKKLTPEQAEQLRRYAEYMFPEAFKE